MSNNSKKYMSAYFSEEMYFGGEKGIINTRLAKFQLMMKRPVIVEFDVYLSNAEIIKFDVTNPIYVDGVNYMVILATLYGNIMKIKAIKMPAI